jgi:hypothetical protein
MKKVATRVSALHTFAVLSKLLRNTPHSFPRINPISKASYTCHSKYDWVLDTYLLMFDIKVCAWCGHTTPVHSDLNVAVMLRRLPDFRLNCLRE